LNDVLTNAIPNRIQKCLAKRQFHCNSFFPSISLFNSYVKSVHDFSRLNDNFSALVNTIKSNKEVNQLSILDQIKYCSDVVKSFQLRSAIF
jgi:hypothetical protein